LIQRFPTIRNLILDENACGLPVGLRLFVYLRCNNNPLARSSGIAQTGNIYTGECKELAEFSFWPLGWILTFDSKDVPGLLEITHWFNYGPNGKSGMSLSIPCRWAASKWPVDFRAPEQIVADQKKNEAYRKERNSL
jgi:hypothetical protein